MGSPSGESSAASLLIDDEEPERQNGSSSRSEKSRDGIGNAGWTDHITQPFLDFLTWLNRLREAFGTPFVASVAIVYGISQGVAETLGSVTQKYYWKDVMQV
jgi:hypothetical protein